MKGVRRQHHYLALILDEANERPSEGVEESSEHLLSYLDARRLPFCLVRIAQTLGINFQFQHQVSNFTNVALRCKKKGWTQSPRAFSQSTPEPFVRNRPRRGRSTVARNTEMSRSRSCKMSILHQRPILLTA